MKSDSSVSGPQRSSIRKEIIDYFKKMKACPMVFEFYILIVVLYSYNMKSSDAKASKCHLKFSSLMMSFIKLVYLSSVISLK